MAVKFKNPYCVIRKDLQEQELSVPICLPMWATNHIFIHGSDRGWRYRWRTEDQMQIKYGNKWYDCHSIDFDFIEP